jgi:hypothetical protein
MGLSDRRVAMAREDRFSVWEVPSGEWRWVVRGVGFIAGGYSSSEDRATRAAKQALALWAEGDGTPVERGEAEDGR